MNIEKLQDAFHSELLMEVGPKSRRESIVNDLVRVVQAHLPHEPVSVGLPECQLCGEGADSPLHSKAEASSDAVQDFGAVRDCQADEIEAHLSHGKTPPPGTYYIKRPVNSAAPSAVPAQPQEPVKAWEITDTDGTKSITTRWDVAKHCDNVEPIAQPAAQRNRAIIEANVRMRNQAWNLALEEAMDACQRVIGSGEYDGHQQYAAAACRDAIRALAGKTAPEAGGHQDGLLATLKAARTALHSAVPSMACNENGAGPDCTPIFQAIIDVDCAIHSLQSTVTPAEFSAATPTALQADGSEGGRAD
jgi:hypothetical protein